MQVIATAGRCASTKLQNVHLGALLGGCSCSDTVLAHGSASNQDRIGAGHDHPIRTAPVLAVTRSPAGGHAGGRRLTQVSQGVLAGIRTMLLLLVDGHTSAPPCPVRAQLGSQASPRAQCLPTNQERAQICEGPRSAIWFIIFSSNTTSVGKA